MLLSFHEIACYEFINETVWAVNKGGLYPQTTLSAGATADEWEELWLLMDLDIQYER
jgi:hypothetical protein